MKKLAILACSILFLITSSANGYDDPVDRAQFTTQVENREPVDDIDELYTDFGDTVYFFTDIVDCVGCEVSHQWIFEGEVVFELSTVPEFERWRWWSAKSQLEEGIWEVHVIVNGELTVTKSLQFIEATPIQMQQAPVQYHVQKELVNDCFEELEYWRSQLSDMPDEPYYQFKVHQWESRCSVR